MYKESRESNMSRNEIDWEKFNPWLDDNENYTEEFIRQVDLYNRNTDSFSWLLEDDVQVLKETYNSLNYGIPTLVNGDVKNSNVFICLYNPATQVGYKTAEDMSPSLHSKEEDLESYIELEVGASKVECISFEDESNKYEQYYRHIINKKNILSLELAAMKELGREPKDDKERKKYYYLYQYFYPLFNENRPAAFKMISKIEEIPNFNLVNIELVPYRSKNKADIKFKKGKRHYDLKVSKFAASIVVNRILASLLDESREKPIFIFRSFAEWADTIDRFIADKSNSEYISGVLGPEKYAYFKNDFDWRNYAFIFRNPQSARIAKNNLCRVMDEEEFNTVKDYFTI